MTTHNASRIQPRDSMYPPNVVPFNLPASNDEPAGEPRDLVDSSPFLVCFGIVVGLVYVVRSLGWLP